MPAFDTTPSKYAPLASSRRRPPRAAAWRRIPYTDLATALLLAAVLVWLALKGGAMLGYNWQWYRVPPFFYRVVDGEIIWGPLVKGLIVTIQISVLSLVLTVVIGLGAALLRLSNSFAGRVIARVYLEAIRNTPLLVQLYVFYFIFSPIFGIDRFWTGVLCLAFFEGAFATEIFRAGIQSVERGQWEAGASLGLTRPQIYRDVVLPQAIRLVLPPLAGAAVTLIKASSIVSVIAVFDLTTEARTIIADTFMSFEIWLTVAVMYLVMTGGLSLMVSWLERKFKSV
jgi:polar amino acid transport system permease protein